jgi:hypothetical protein
MKAFSISIAHSCLFFGSLKGNALQERPVPLPLIVSLSRRLRVPVKAAVIYDIGSRSAAI